MRIHALQGWLSSLCAPAESAGGCGCSVHGWLPDLAPSTNVHGSVLSGIRGSRTAQRKWQLLRLVRTASKRKSLKKKKLHTASPRYTQAGNTEFYDFTANILWGCPMALLCWEVASPGNDKKLHINNFHPGAPELGGRGGPPSTPHTHTHTFSSSFNVFFIANHGIATNAPLL